MSAGWRVGKINLARELLTFVRRSNAPIPKLAAKGQRPRSAPPGISLSPSALRKKTNRDIVDYTFSSLGRLELRRNADGTPWSHQPQSRYVKAAGSKLNRYGGGDFCEIRVAAAPHGEGVYALFAAEDLVYVGEAVDLSRRWYHYGHISPRSCFQGGQETNCRVNKLILDAVREGQQLSLWFCPTDRRKEIEADIRRRLHPPWNAI